MLDALRRAAEGVLPIGSTYLVTDTDPARYFAVLRGCSSFWSGSELRFGKIATISIPEAVEIKRSSEDDLAL